MKDQFVEAKLVIEGSFDFLDATGTVLKTVHGKATIPLNLSEVIGLPEAVGTFSQEKRDGLDD